MTSLLDTCAEYIQIIQDVFEKRREKNPSYSLRAFAKSLSIDPSSLSAILANKRSLPLHKADDFILKLKLDEETSARFAKSLLSRSTSVIRNMAYQEGLTIDEEQYFSIIAEWEYFAVLSLINLKDFNPSALWIAKRLGIDQQRAEEVFTRLINYKLLEIKEGKYVASYGRIKTSEDVSSAALRMAHLEELDLVKEKIVKLPVDQRHISSVTISIKEENIEKANAMIRAFRKQMETLFESEEDADEVYQLGIQFYPLTTRS